MRVEIELKPNRDNPTYELVEYDNVLQVKGNQYGIDIYTEDLGRTNFRYDKISTYEILNNDD